MYCINIGLVIVFVIILALIGWMVPGTKMITDILSVGLWLWWIAGFFMECDKKVKLF